MFCTNLFKSLEIDAIVKLLNVALADGDNNLGGWLNIGFDLLHHFQALIWDRNVLEYDNDVRNLEFQDVLLIKHLRAVAIDNLDAAAVREPVAFDLVQGMLSASLALAEHQVVHKRGFPGARLSNERDFLNFHLFRYLEI